MSRTATHWTDERLDDLADAIEPIPVKVAVLDATVKHLTSALEPVPSELAVERQRHRLHSCATRRAITRTLGRPQ